MISHLKRMVQSFKKVGYKRYICTLTCFHCHANKQTKSVRITHLTNLNTTQIFRKLSKTESLWMQEQLVITSPWRDNMFPIIAIVFKHMFTHECACIKKRACNTQTRSIKYEDLRVGNICVLTLCYAKWVNMINFTLYNHHLIFTLEWNEDYVDITIVIVQHQYIVIGKSCGQIVKHTYTG